MLTGALVKNRIRCCALVLVGSSALFASSGVQENDWVIVPGKRVGPITPAATRADLVRLFGGSQVSDSEILKTDFGTETGTIVFAERPELSLATFWKTEVPDSRIRRIRVLPQRRNTGQVSLAHRRRHHHRDLAETAGTDKRAYFSSQRIRLGIWGLDHFLARRPS